MLPAVKSEKGDIDSLRGPVCLGPDPLIDNREFAEPAFYCFIEKMEVLISWD